MVIMADTEDNATSSGGQKRKADWFDIDEKHNSYVYVSGLPRDLTEEEFVDLMKKYGIIAKKAAPGNPLNIKMYKDADGSFKGDALCCYVRVESVQLAIDLLDGYAYDDKHTISCQRAKFQMKGDYDATKKPKFPDKRNKMHQKKKTEKLLSWEPKPEIKQKKVVIKYMFTPEELDSSDDDFTVLTIKEDIEEICEKFQCEPKRIDVNDRHPDGVVEVTFGEHEQAEKFIAAIAVIKTYNNRQVHAELWDGKTRYKVKETDEEAQKRLEKWHERIKQASDDEDDTIDDQKALNVDKHLDDDDNNEGCDEKNCDKDEEQ